MGVPGMSTRHAEDVGMYVGFMGGYPFLMLAIVQLTGAMKTSSASSRIADSSAVIG
jgi:hypothetical protein